MGTSLKQREFKALPKKYVVKDYSRILSRHRTKDAAANEVARRMSQFSQRCEVSEEINEAEAGAR